MSSLSVTGSLSRAPSGRSGNLPLARLAAFSTLAMPVAAAQVPVNVYLPALLAQHFGIALSTLGVVFLLAKSWGVIADPLIGVLSDRNGGRLGRRRTWIAGGGLLLALATLLLFFPVAGITPVYVAVALFAFYLAWSMVQIPYLAWSAEISGDYDERTRVATYQTVASALALRLLGMSHWIMWELSALFENIGTVHDGISSISLPPTVDDAPGAPALPQARGLGLLIIDHDMGLIMRLCRRLHVLASGRTIATGTAEEVRRDPAVIEAYLGSEAAHA